MRKLAADLQRGDSVYSSDGRVCGEVTHKQNNAVYLDLGFPAPTIIKGQALQRDSIRLGPMRIFCNKDRYG